MHPCRLTSACIPTSLDDCSCAKLLHIGQTPGLLLYMALNQSWIKWDLITKARWQSLLLGSVLLVSHLIDSTLAGHVKTCEYLQGYTINISQN
jgi:hypothetical protein